MNDGATRAMYRKRCERVLENLGAMGLGQMLVCDPLSILYLTGYYTEPFERFLALLITHADAREGFTEQWAPAEPSPVRTILFTNRLFPSAAGVADKNVAFDDAEDPVPLVAAELADGALGVDQALSAKWLLPLMETGAAGAFRLASRAVDDARSIKDAHERDLMREASRINDKSIDWLVSQLYVGVTEREVTSGLLACYRDLGAEDVSFTPIVSFGANAADPHHEPDDTVLRRGDMVLFDVGCKYRSYCSDMTRTFFTAKPRGRQLEVYDTVRRANEAAEAAVRPGVTFAELDHLARSVIDEAGYGPFFTHRLGHQIGLRDHEPTDVSSANHEQVRPGQCFSIEPGIYIPGEIGVRIEDLVLVREDGHELLNHYPHEPVVLGL